MDPPDVQPFLHAPTGTWSYVVADPATGDAAVVDPVLDFDLASARTGTASAEALLRHVHARGLAVRWILETHAHADHLSAAQWLKPRLPQARVAIGAGIRDVQRRFSTVFDLGADFVADGSQFDHLFDADDAFELGTLAARVLATPGHTGDSVAYLVGDALFCGDSLFLPDAGSARCDFPGADAATLYRSIQRLFRLPDATRVFVCHDYGAGGRAVRCASTIGEQKRANVHVRVGVGETDFVALRDTRDATLAPPQLLLPALQVNLRAGALPPASGNGVRYLQLPLDVL